MSSMNKVIFIGNLTRDPELRYTPQGTAVASFGMAMNHRYKQGEEWKEDVCFIDCTAFGRQAETITEYLAKGRQVCVEGRLRWNTWETPEGQRRSKHEVIVEKAMFLGQGGGGESGGSRPAQRPARPAAPESTQMDDDDLPF